MKRAPLSRDEIVRLDRAHVWHPYTPVDRWEETLPIVVARAEGSSLYDVDGTRYIDGNSSWWVAALGHGHPRLVRVLREQAETLAHCALAGIAHEPSSALAEELVRITPSGLNRVFYSDDGSTAVEVAVKIALQTWQHRGAPRKTRFIALDGAFHGDTIGASSLGGVEVFRRPFASVLFECVRAPFPDESAYEQAFATIRDLVTKEHDTIAAIVVEPLVQGAAGMRMYSPDYLRALRDLTRAHDVLLIIDEVFTGYGRTGTMFACEQAGITPDVMCIGKAFAAIIPMAATLVTDAVYDTYRGSDERALWYGHTFCGNPMGAALAREVLAIYEDEDVLGQVNAKAPRITAAFERIGAIPGVARVRTLGMIGAADLQGGTGYLGRAGWRVYEEARRRGAYLRPLGDTVYVCPPLVIGERDLDDLLQILEDSVRAFLGATGPGALRLVGGIEDLKGKVLTQYSTHANMIADTVRAAFAKSKVGTLNVEMTAPEDSTKGGLLALQHVILKPETGMALVVGTVNAGDKRAELRSYAHVAKVNEERFKRPLPFDEQTYAAFLEKASGVLGAFGIETKVNDAPRDTAPSFADPKEEEAPRSRSVLSTVLVLVLLVLVILFGAGWLFALRR